MYIHIHTYIHASTHACIHVKVRIKFRRIFLMCICTCVLTCIHYVAALGHDNNTYVHVTNCSNPGMYAYSHIHTHIFCMDFDTFISSFVASNRMKIICIKNLLALRLHFTILTQIFMIYLCTRLHSLCTRRCVYCIYELTRLFTHCTHAGV